MIKKLKFGIEVHVEATEGDVEELKHLIGGPFTAFVRSVKVITEDWETIHSSNQTTRNES